MFSRLITRIGRQARRNGTMMAHLGVPPETLARLRGGTALAAAARACIACRQGEACDRWTISSPAPAPHAPPFCPNAARLDEAKGLQASSHPR